MPVTSVAGGYASGINNDYFAPEDKTTLKTDDFFKLMAAQLQNQTMYDTVDSTEYISQMAQFSLLSQMQEMNRSVQQGYAVSLIGKEVTVSAQSPEGGTVFITGTAGNVSYFDSKPYISIDGGFFELSQVVQVSGKEAAVPTENITNQEAAAEAKVAADAIQDEDNMALR